MILPYTQKSRKIHIYNTNLESNINGNRYLSKRKKIRVYTFHFRNDFFLILFLK